MGYENLMMNGAAEIQGNYAAASTFTQLGKTLVLEKDPQLDRNSFISVAPGGFNRLMFTLRNNGTVALADFKLAVLIHKDAVEFDYISGATWGTVAGVLKYFKGALNTLGAGAYAHAYVDIGPVYAVKFYAKGAGTDILTNGVMSANTDWTQGAGWGPIAAGVAPATAASTTFKQLKAAMATPWTDGLAYEATFDVTVASGSLGVGTNTDPTSGYGPITSSGTYSRTVFADAHADGLVFTGDAFTGTLDNVTLKESPLTGVYPRFCRE